MTTQLAEKTSLLTEINNKLMEKDNQLTEKDNQITEKDNQLTEKDNQLTEKDNLLKNSSLREKLTEALVKAERFDDLKRSIENPAYRAALIEELKLTFE